MRTTVMMIAATLALAAPAAAQDDLAVAEAQDGEERPSDGAAAAQELFTQMFSGMAEEMRAELPPVDPERLALGVQLADKVLPAGVMQEMMASSMGMGMAGKMLDGTMQQMPLSVLAQVGGLSPDEAAELGDTTIAQVMDIIDPYYKQRMTRMIDGVTTFVASMAGEMEPVMREGLGRAYASRFTLEQLAATRDFFATPAGSAFAADSYLIFADPEMMAATVEVMPKMMSRLPEMMAALESDDALPPARTMADLSDAERARLADLLGVEEDELSDPPTDGMMQQDDGEAADLSNGTGIDT